MGGITRITEGTVTNTSTSMKLSANDGDYQLNAAGKIQLKGDEGGVEFNDYKPPHKDDVLSTGINVSLNLFFDGTQNNKNNTEARDPNSKNHQSYLKTGNKKDDSFENDYTNVARGFDAINPEAINQVAVYVEGMGTQNDKKDTMLPGVSFGEGETGIEAKVTKGCFDAAEQMKLKGHAKKIIDILFVNVYGFSRGAAAARHFIHVASTTANYMFVGKVAEGKNTYQITPNYLVKDQAFYFDIEAPDTSFIEKYGYFGACLLSRNMRVKEIQFNFIGLYDSVAAFGLDHRGKKVFGVSVINGDTKQLNLDAIKKANYVLHLASADEYRDNFDLTNINSAGIKGFELLLPGVHSDIGGSYIDGGKELSVLDNIEVSRTMSKEQTETPEERAKRQKSKGYDDFKKLVVAEGWYNDLQLTKEFFQEKDFDESAAWYSNAYQYNYGLVGRRTLSNSYDKIPLKIMIKKSISFQVEYTDKQLEKYEIKDATISQVYDDMSQYIEACVVIRNKYVRLYNGGNKQNFIEMSAQYLKEVKTINYKSFISPDELKNLRNNFLHWSVKSNLIGLSARHEGALPENERKRENQDG